MTRYFEDVELGDELGPLEKVADDASVGEFCEIWLSSIAGRFTDHEAARREGLPGALVPGIMALAYMEQLLQQWAEGGSLRKLDVVFRQLVFHNVPLRVVGVVVDKEDGKESSLVECDVFLEDAQGSRLVGGKATVALPSRGQHLSS